MKVLIWQSLNSNVSQGFLLLKKKTTRLAHIITVFVRFSADVTADFTVELKKVDNQTMVVRAARAKLVSKDRNIKLQGMDERGPVSRILDHGNYILYI